MSTPETNPSEGSPLLLRTREGLSLQFAGSRAVQSTMSLLNTYALDLEYTRLMMGFLLFNSQPKNIMMVGLGGGSIPKFCYRYLPETEITVVEINPDVIALRDAFHIPPDDVRFQVIEADGCAYVNACSATIDVVLIDAYDGEGMPAPLCEPSFFQDCADVLSEDGVLVVNLHLESDSYAICLAHLRDVFGTALIEVIDDDMTNSIVYAGKGEHFHETDLQAALRKPSVLSKDAWRQLYPTFKVIEATHVLR